MGTRVTRKGQVTIPKPVREYLGIAPGNVVAFELAPDGRIVLFKQGAPGPSHHRRAHGQAARRGRLTCRWSTDLVPDDPIWADWSTRQPRILSAQETGFVNAVVWAELSVAYDRMDEVDTALDAVGVELVEIPRAALFLAGKAFQSYRRAAARGPACCPTSSSGLMPWSQGSRF